MAAPYIVITASDEGFRHLLLDWVQSLRRLDPGFALDIGILDLGLSDETKRELAAYDVILKPAKADIEYPGRILWEKEMPYYRAMTARPFLPDYFPGYQALMWVDADAWFQTAEALTIMLPAAAATNELHIAVELDRDYRMYFESAAVWQVQYGWYKNCFAPKIADNMSLRPMLNVGVFAMTPDCRAWQGWRDIMIPTIQQIPKLTTDHFMLEQLCLNVAIYLGGIKAQIMPVEYNWVSLMCPPFYDEAAGLYVRPSLPRSVISILHLAGGHKASPLTIRTTAKTELTRYLTYAAWRQAQPAGG